MTHYYDMELCNYHDGAFDYNNWNCPLLTIGWLEKGKNYTKGSNFPFDLRDRIAFLRFAFSEKFPSILFRGYHECSLCKLDINHDATLYHSHVNLFVPDEKNVYVIPGRVDHYIEEHNYQIPNEVIKAIMNCPDPRTDDFKNLVKKVNNNSSSPLY